VSGATPRSGSSCGVSPDYYTRLEQGRHPTASPAVLDALARALRLSAVRRVWRQHEVSACEQGVRTLRHALLGGELRMRSEAVTARSSPDQVFYLMVPVDPAFETAYLNYLGTGGGKNP